MARIRRSPRFSPYLLTVVCLLLVSVCRVATVWAQATLENPAADSYQSGLGLISGWACEAGRIEIEFNHDPRTRQPASYGTPRGDTAGACGDSDNGFGLLINWNLLGDGTHTVRALADGVAFGQATVTVTTLGQEYAQGLRREVPVDGFPRAGQQRTLVWQESQQNFVITAGQPAQGGGTRGTATQQLENPQPGSYQSGLGLISGWVCAAGRIEIEFNGDPHTRQRAGYGTPRGDTAGVCGDSDNGFGLLFNWNLLGNGMHTVRALADGQEFAHSTVTVSTLGQEYAQELSREVTLADFPAVGQTTTLAWQESQQNFVITGSTAGGPVLSIAAPDPVPGFFADVLGILRPVVSYTGEAPLSFTLPTAPPGMEIDARSGTIAWTPPASATGRTFAVMVEAESDELFDRVEFQVSVLRTTPLQTTVANGALTVTDGGTDLHGLRITTPATRLRLSDLRLETVEREAVLATVPAALTLLSDFFVIREPFAQPVELTFPVGDLPAGTDIRDVDLYRFREATGSDGPFWGSVLVDWRYEMVSGEPAYIVSLEGLHGLFVFGLPGLVPGGRATSNAAPVGDRRIVTPAVSQSLAATQASVSKVECFPNPWFSLLEPNYRSQTCTYADDPAVEIAVKDFVQLNSNERWGMGIEEFVARVIEIQEELEKLGLAYDKDITIDFDIPLNTSVLDAFTHDRLGEVTCVNWLDRAKTLRIYPANINNATNLDKLPLNDLAVETIAHEYFHHAQCHEGNEMPGLDLAVLQIDGKGSVTSHLLGNHHWLTEGSADWFAHSAVPATRSIRAEILEVGLDSIQDDDDLRKWPYFRAPFFAMLKERCADFSSLLKKILSIDEDSGASGINRLAEVLARSRCTFGALGTDLGGALAEYQITTFDEDQKPSDEQNAFGYHIDLVDGRSYGENYTKDNFNDDIHPISIPLPAVAAGTLYLDIIGITGGAFAAQDTVEVSMASNALVKLSDETCTDIHGQPQCTGQPLRSIPSTPWLLRAPSSNEVHRFRATLVNPDLEEAAEVTVTVRLVSAPPGIPPAPTNLRATADASSVTLEWDAVAGTGMRYVVYQHYGGGRHWAREVAGSSTTFSGLEADTEYCWDVVAVNTARQESAPSAARCARTGTGGGGVTTGETFADSLTSGGQGPEMVVIPAGSFRMGCLSDDGDCLDNEKPVHDVHIGHTFALSVQEVTRGEFRRFVDATGHATGDSCQMWVVRGRTWENRRGFGWQNPGFEQTDAHPVVCVSWEDAKAYAAWLSRETGETYRLPSEAEWEYAARAGTETKYHWGNEMEVNRENCRGCGSPWDGRQTAPVGSFDPNGWGLHDMYGNVYEWTEDCWHGNHQGAPSDGGARTSGDCGRRVLRGGSWSSEPRNIRAARRLYESTGYRDIYGGFRIARSLTPSDDDDDEGETFADSLTSGGQGPEMVVIPAGSFRMGCLNDDGDCESREFPVHTVRVPRFALSKYTVTFEQWDACVDAGGCRGYRPSDAGWGRGLRPVIHVNWHDAQSYVSWLSQQTGEEYRLPSEAEWEYAARAGTETKYHWGDEIGVNRANCKGCGSQWDSRQTAPVGSFDPNTWGLHDMHGNVWEWTEDCLNDSYEGAPSDGIAWTSGDCSRPVQRGGAWGYNTWLLRAAKRGGNTASHRYHGLGFRVARTLD